MTEVEQLFATSFEEVLGIARSRVTPNGLWRADDNIRHPWGYPEYVEVEHCIRWLRKFAIRTRTIRPHLSSYGYKHIVEEWAGYYICNGAFIVALYLEGYMTVSDIPGSLNVRTNIGVRLRDE